MDSNANETEQRGSSRVTLYLESSEFEPAEMFCTDVFPGTEKGEYRVVQVTARQSFESVRDALNTHLDQIKDPSEAAAIITTPQASEESETTRVGEQTPLHGYKVRPEDLTGISIAVTQLVETWEDEEGTVNICLRNIESLLPYHDADLVYRFLNTILATLRGAGVAVHAHLRADAVDDHALQLLQPLFDEVVEKEHSKLREVSETSAGGDQQPSQTTENTTADPFSQPADLGSNRDVSSGAMSDEKTDEFLQEQGYGTLSFAGEAPYAVPMSYGYDAERRVIYLQLASFDGSEKRARLNESSDVSLVVSRYERPDQWRSVVIEGSVVRLTDEEVNNRNVAATFANSEMASIHVFVEDLTNVSFDWYVLEPTTISGRRSVGSL